jgi:hypothetical protein
MIKLYFWCTLIILEKVAIINLVLVVKITNEYHASYSLRVKIFWSLNSSTFNLENKKREKKFNRSSFLRSSGMTRMVLFVKGNNEFRKQIEWNYGVSYAIHFRLTNHCLPFKSNTWRPLIWCSYLLLVFIYIPF